MEPTPELLSQMRRERIERARRMSPADKLAAGLQLYSLAIECMRAGVLLQNPGADETQIRTVIRRRLQNMRRKDEGLFDGAA